MWAGGVFACALRGTPYPASAPHVPHLSTGRKYLHTGLASAQVNRKGTTHSSPVAHPKPRRRSVPGLIGGGVFTCPARYPDCMRTPKRIEHEDGTIRWKVRFRLGGRETSETFPRKADAEMFSRMVSGGRPDSVVEALEWLESKRKDVATATFAEWFAAWSGQLTGITPRTRADYDAMHRRYLAELDPLPITLVSRAHVAAIVNRLEREGKSRKTIANAVHMLSSVMSLAVDEGHIARNPCKRVRLPKQDTEEHAPRFLTYDEAGALIAATVPHYRPLVTFLFGTGLRWSEATALPCRNVNLEAGTVRVDRAWKRIPGGQEVGPPKSAKSRRTVNAAVAALAAVQPLLRKPNDLVFTAPQGGPVRHSNFYNRVWVPACDGARLDPRPRLHDCSHSFASWLISDGTPLEAVQDQLGHESYDTTRKLYAHLLPAVGVAAGRSASAAMEQVLAHQLRAGVLAISSETDHARESDEVSADV